MIRVTCDTCEQPIDREDDRWFGVDLNEPIVMPDTSGTQDPVQAMNELDEAMLATANTALNAGISFDHKHHFCSAGCLSSWAFGQELEDTP